MYSGFDHFIPEKDKAFVRKARSIVSNIQGNDTLKGELSTLLEEHSKIATENTSRIEKIFEANAKRNEIQDKQISLLKSQIESLETSLNELRKWVVSRTPPKDEKSEKDEKDEKSEKFASLLEKATDLISSKSKQSLLKMIESSAKESSTKESSREKPLKKRLVSTIAKA